MFTSNLNKLYHNINKLKEQGINYDLKYTLEYTTSPKVLEQIDKKGDFSNIDKIEFNNLNKAVNVFLKHYDNQYTLWCQLWQELIINDLTVSEDLLMDITRTNIEEQYITRINELEEQLNKTNNAINIFTEKYNCKNIFNDILKET